MSQEYTEEKVVTLKHMSSGHRLYEALLILVALFAIYLMVSLLSFDPSDPSWSQTAWQEPINNIGGAIGAWLADTLFFVFGVLAYAIPPVVLAFCWFSYKKQDRGGCVDYFAIALRLIGMLALILSSCGLASLNVDDLYYFASGGLIGGLLSNVAIPMMGHVGTTLILMGGWAIGVTLLTGWSWLTIAEKMGALLMGGLTSISHRISHRASRESFKESQGTTHTITKDQSDGLLPGFEEDDPLLCHSVRFGAEPDEPLPSDALRFERREKRLVDFDPVEQEALTSEFAVTQSSPALLARVRGDNLPEAESSLPLLYSTEPLDEPAIVRLDAPPTPSC